MEDNKMKLNKIFALVIALMIMTMSLAAYAVETNGNGTLNDNNGIESGDNTIGIAKQIVFINDENTDVREPNITYTYTIASADPTNAAITESGTVLPVSAGPIGAVNAQTAIVSFADTYKAAASSTGTGVTKHANFSFNPTTFGAPGIYRYQITESTSPAKAAVGITEAATYEDTRFLDVYVKWSDDEHNTLAIYGYVLFEGNEDDNIDTNDVSAKSQGYVNTATTGQADVDVYTTENLYINKVTTGTLADKNHDFPIAVTLTAPTGVNNVKLDVTKTGGTLNTQNDAVGDHVATWGAVAGTVRNGSQIAIKGVPAGATVSVVETNDTADSYKVKAGTAAGKDNLLTEAIVLAGNDAGATTAVTLNANSEIHFTNTLDAISPTGVVMRFAPYALMLAAGLLIVILGKRRKNKDED